MHKIDLETLKREGLLWQGVQGTRAVDGVAPSGWPALDDLLGGGWPRRALIEITSDAHQGISLLIPLLARLSVEPRWTAWIAPPYVPYAPALAARGIEVARLLLVHDVSSSQALWAAEQALKSAACSIVLAWPDVLQVAQLRRLQLAAEQGRCLGVLFREARTARQSSPAALRLRVRPAPLGLEVEVLKRRGGWGGGSCIVPVGEPVSGPEKRDIASAPVCSG
jgi:cell division inhibitor SulA/protein ImuA